MRPVCKRQGNIDTHKIKIILINTQNMNKLLTLCNSVSNVKQPIRTRILSFGGFEEDLRTEVKH